MATFNPFNPDGTWRWEVNGKDLGDLGVKAKAGKKAEEPWNQWQSQKSIQELNAYNQWKQAYIKFNDTTTKPGENWFRQEWDRNEAGIWEDEMQDTFTAQMDYEERLAFRAYGDAYRYKTAKEEAAAWVLHGRAEWWANKSRPDAWKELLKQAERNRQQRKQESYGGRSQGKNHWYQQYQDFFNSGRPKLTEELARALILSNLDKFDVHYAEYWQRQRRMQMNEAKSKIGQLSIVHVPTIQERFMQQCRQSGATEHEAAMLAETVWPPLSEKNEAYDNFVSRVMSPLFKWNC
ncbi:MAG TPA: hypothetical protein VN038_01375 [Dyadobacter sp.]|nr:hypothetical protein [Dyadobacter sp.]